VAERFSGLSARTASEMVLIASGFVSHVDPGASTLFDIIAASRCGSRAWSCTPAWDCHWQYTRFYRRFTIIQRQLTQRIPRRRPIYPSVDERSALVREI